MSMRISKLSVCLLLVGIVAVAVGVVGWQAQAAKYNEAPMLKELVEKGELPPVEERLPKNPMIIEPEKEIGTYGGTLRKLYDGSCAPTYRFIGGNFLFGKDENYECVPNLVASWEYSQGGRVVTLHFREGAKWSDGHPLTVDDFIFTWEDLILDENYVQMAPAVLQAGLVEIRKVDDYTVELTYEHPTSFETLNPWAGGQMLLPKHWAKQYHPKYNPDLRGSYEMLNKKAVPFSLTESWTERPWATPWVPVEYKINERLVAERNPYYYGVDTAGNQLPYIDRVVMTEVGTAEEAAIELAAGHVDVELDALLIRDYPVYKRNEEKGGYEVRLVKSGDLGPAISLWYDSADPIVREYTKKFKFREALSLAVNREEISDIVYFGLAEPWSYCGLRESPVFPGMEYGKLYTEYDPERAKQLLDELGFKDVDGDGFREDPYGEDFNIILDYQLTPQAYSGPSGGIAEVLKEQWKKVGIDLVLNPLTYDALRVRSNADQTEAFLWKADNAGGYPIFRGLRWTFEDLGYEQKYKSAVRWWRTGGKEGEEPLEWVKRLQELGAKARGTMDPEERIALQKEIFRINAEQISSISTTTMVYPCVVGNRIGNFPDDFFRAFATQGTRLARPYQFFIKQER